MAPLSEGARKLGFSCFPLAHLEEGSPLAAKSLGLVGVPALGRDWVEFSTSCEAYHQWAPVRCSLAASGGPPMPQSNSVVDGGIRMSGFYVLLCPSRLAASTLIVMIPGWVSRRLLCANTQLRWWLLARQGR